MNIMFCGDNNVCTGIALSVLSVIRHVHERTDIFILTAGIGMHNAISEDFAQKLDKIVTCKNQGSVKLVDISDKFLSYLPLANMKTRFTPLCMLRLFADIIDEIPDKVLYMDADVMCRADFSDMYRTDMGKYEIMGVPDRYGKWFFGHQLLHDYLNSGVLLINMEKIRESGLFEKCRTMCRDKQMFMPDQTALNKLAVKAKLPSRYNCQGRIRKDTVFKHFTTYFELLPYFHAVTVKPWDVDKMHEKLGIYEFDDIIKQYKEYGL